MQSFMNEDFLLKTETARRLYHDYAEKMPIVDYHCHINPQEIADDRSYDSITQVWLYGDHYKWRMIRSNGVDESLITDPSASDYDRFYQFAKSLPRAIGNPLYHWTHLELKRYFGVDEPLNAESAPRIYEKCNAILREPGMTVRGIIKRSGVKLICTTDDPIDILSAHQAILADPTCEVKVLPAWRPDKAVNIDKGGFVEYLRKLSQVSGVEIKDMQSLYQALSLRLDFFCELGCLASDHGLDRIPFKTASEAELDGILQKALNGEVVTAAEAEAYQTAMLLFFGREYARRGMVMQLHYGVLRNTNSRMFKKLGPDTGFDCMGDEGNARKITLLLDALAADDQLPKTVLYSINPNDNASLDTILGAFQSTEAAGKLQHGSAWWFNDTKRGMEEQLISLANLSVLGNFIGMLTDSRSYLSYTRHEYFRRILCNLLGEWVENGEYPADMDALGGMVEDICYNNTVRYFGFPL